MKEKLSCHVAIHQGEMDRKKVFVVECVELGINDFGHTKKEALTNLKNAIHLFLEEHPERKHFLIKPKTVKIKKLSL
jgi:predicted RNase H-like HicB family nuclease